MTGTVIRLQNSENGNESSATAFVLEDPYPRTLLQVPVNELLSTSSFQTADTSRSL